MFYEMSIMDEKVLRLRNEKRLVEEDGDLETEVKGRLIGAGVYQSGLSIQTAANEHSEVDSRDLYSYIGMRITGDDDWQLVVMVRADCLETKEGFYTYFEISCTKLFVSWSRVLEIQTAIWTSDITTNRYLVVVVCSSSL